MICEPLHLIAGCGPGQSQPFFSLQPDGSSALFTLPAGAIFNLTDISVVPANITSPTPTFVMFGLRQQISTGTVQLWNFAGYIAQNVERSFVIPVRFGKDFTVHNEPASVTLSVNLFGYLTL